MLLFFAIRDYETQVEAEERRGHQERAIATEANRTDSDLVADQLCVQMIKYLLDFHRSQPRQSKIETFVTFVNYHQL